MIQLYTHSKPLLERLGEIDLIFATVTGVDNLFSDTIVISDPDSAKEILTQRNDLNLLVLSDNPNFEEGSKLLVMGIKGYGNSFMFKLHFDQAISMIQSGNVWLSPSFVQEMITQIKSDKMDYHAILEKLTEREREIALHVSDGMSNKEIAIALDITERTVKQHMSHIFEKLNVSDRLSLALLLK